MEAAASQQALPGTEGMERCSFFSEDKEDGVSTGAITDPRAGSHGIAQQSKEGFGGAEPAAGRRALELLRWDEPQG